MCYRTKLTKDIAGIQAKFEGLFESVPDFWEPKVEINGFTLPQTPIICNDNIKVLTLAQWGYEVNWMSAPLLNAKYETAKEKKSFKEFMDQRCLILVNGFYEWQWLDPKGKEKQKYLMHIPQDELFYLAGQFKDSVNHETGEVVREYVVYTLKAEGVMKKIHNTKERMPYAFFEIEEAMDFLENREPIGCVEFVSLQQ